MKASGTKELDPETAGRAFDLFAQYMWERGWLILNLQAADSQSRVISYTLPGCGPEQMAELLKDAKGRVLGVEEERVQ